MPKIKPSTVWLVDGTRIDEKGGIVLDIDAHGLMTISAVETMERPVLKKNIFGRIVKTGKTSMQQVKVPIKSYPVSRIKEIDWGYASPELYNKIKEELAKEKAKQEEAKAKERKEHGNQDMPNNVEGGRK